MKIAQHKVVQTQSLSERYSSLKNMGNYFYIVSNSKTIYIWEDLSETMKIAQHEVVKTQSTSESYITVLKH